ncbi:hypothetical protein CANARDRAFT_28607 [[Candida] arabinofermentans NRRL YB-2248]|uniref:Uncharacterized protein n=1 Tax=[Candida] arabinofermentans NRRL YB-2248 TaxID=983967 RepID=A0A1E4SZD7_9ASCO|nr:hypothetical protein CANARDRAFT_28607 [[Candida] arabinofermentans NRRL YB-2248]
MQQPVQRYNNILHRPHINKSWRNNKYNRYQGCNKHKRYRRQIPLHRLNNYQYNTYNSYNGRLHRVRNSNYRQHHLMSNKEIHR